MNGRRKGFFARVQTKQGRVWRSAERRGGAGFFRLSSLFEVEAKGSSLAPAHDYDHDLGSEVSRLRGHAHVGCVLDPLTSHIHRSFSSPYTDFLPLIPSVSLRRGRHRYRHAK